MASTNEIVCSLVASAERNLFAIMIYSAEHELESMARKVSHPVKRWGRK